MKENGDRPFLFCERLNIEGVLYGSISTMLGRSHNHIALPNGEERVRNSLTYASWKVFYASNHD